MPTEQQVATTVVGIINAALPASVRAYDPSTAPTGDDRPSEFVVVTLARRFGGLPNAGRYTTTGWGFYVMAASRSSVVNARNSLRIVGAAIESERLSVAGEVSTPVRFDSARPVAEDDEWFSGVNVYTCAI